jgi:hypothetical protein
MSADWSEEAASLTAVVARCDSFGLLLIATYEEPYILNEIVMAELIGRSFADPESRCHNWRENWLSLKGPKTSPRIDGGHLEQLLYKSFASI